LKTANRLTALAIVIVSLGGTKLAGAPVATDAASCSADPCEKECACAPRCCSKCACDRTPKVSLSISGIRGSFTNVAVAGRRGDSAISVALAGAVDIDALDGTTHGAMYFVLGGGQAGFEGARAGTVDFGYRLPVAEDHGPFGRIGFDGRLQGNDLYYFSILELPRGSVGYQYLKGKTIRYATRAATNSTVAPTSISRVPSGRSLGFAG